MWGLVRSTWHTAGHCGQVNRNKHFVKTLLHLEDIFFDGLTILVNELNSSFFPGAKKRQDYVTSFRTVRVPCPELIPVLVSSGISFLGSRIF